MIALLKDLTDFQPVQTVTNLEGWPVYDDEGNEIGTAVSYIVDTYQNHLLYLAVNYQGKTLMVPLEQIMLDFKNHAVKLVDADRDQLDRYPEFKPGETVLEREREYYVTFAPKEEAGRTMPTTGPTST